MEKEHKQRVSFPFFVSARIRANQKNNFSSLISKIAVGSIAVGLAVMIVSFAIFHGYEGAIQEKIFSFSAHFRVSKFVTHNSYEEIPVSTTSYIYEKANAIPGVKHIQVYSQKAGMLKTDDEIMGAVLKGIASDFDSTRFKKNMIEGRFINFDSGELYSTEIIISKKISNKLKLGIGDSVNMYFLQEPPRMRRLQVCGIYETGIEDFDNLIVLGDNKIVQRLNNWGDTLVGGFELFIDDFGHIDDMEEIIYDEMDFDLGISKVTDRYVQFFDWFVMLNRNVFVFLTVILFVACFNIVSITLIMIMERTNMIGILKALGATNGQVRQIFIFHGYRLIVQGLVLGNIIGLGFCYAQQRWKWVPLDPENYYVDAVPISFNWGIVAMLNITLALLVAFILATPTFVISRMEPIKAIRFD